MIESSKITQKKDVEVKARTLATLPKLVAGAEDLPLIAEDAPEKTGERA